MFLRKIFLVIFLVNSLILSAQIKDSIYGVVVDEQQKTIPYVNVEVLSPTDSSFVNGGVTTENGQFSVQIIPSIYLLKILSLGYQTVYKTIDCQQGKTDAGTLVLNESTYSLNEVTIKANRPTIQTKNGIMSVDVANSPLSKEHNVQDILLKIPGVFNNKGSLEVFGLGEPIIYINGKKITDKNEIKQLTVDEIKTVELNTTPDASYDATGQPVLKIITYHKQDGFFGQIDVSGIQNQYFSTDNDVNIGYIHNNLNLSAYYEIDHDKTKVEQPFQQTLYADTTWMVDGVRPRLVTNLLHSYKVSADYAINTHNTIGIQYDGSALSSKDKAEERDNVWANGEAYQQLHVNNIKNQNSNKNHVNFFYLSNWNDKWNCEAYVDYFNNKSRQPQNIQEITDVNNITNTILNSNSHLNLFAATATLKYKIKGNNWILAGATVNKVTGNGSIESNSPLIDSTQYHNNESKGAFFVQYNMQYNQISLSAGLRFENTAESYSDIFMPASNIKKNYSNLFPNLALSYNHNGFNETTAFTSSIVRPAFAWLNSNTYYMNQFMYQRGNPALQPQLSYSVSQSGSYKFVNINLSYRYMKNYITQVFVPSDDNQQIINTWENINKAQMLRATVTLQQSFQWWHPVLSMGVIKPFVYYNYLDNQISNNKPNFFLMTTHSIDLPLHYLLSLSYYYSNGGSQNFSVLKPYQYLNVSLQKSFFADKLNISLQGNDLFHTLVYKTETRVNNAQLNQTENYSQWNYTINITYKFNNKTSKYRGKSADQDVIKRL